MVVPDNEGQIMRIDIVRPVLEALGLSTPPSGTEKMTRVFWCPTGPFSFLPIHAAGLYGAAQAGVKLSDFVISSCIPTLSALAPSVQNVSNDLPSAVCLLLIPQPPEDGQMRHGSSSKAPAVAELAADMWFIIMSLLSPIDVVSLSLVSSFAVENHFQCDTVVKLVREWSKGFSERKNIYQDGYP